MVMIKWFDDIELGHCSDQIISKLDWCQTFQLMWCDQNIKERIFTAVPFGNANETFHLDGFVCKLFFVSKNETGFR